MAEAAIAAEESLLSVRAAYMAFMPACLVVESLGRRTMSQPKRRA